MRKVVALEVARIRGREHLHHLGLVGEELGTGAEGLGKDFVAVEAWASAYTRLSQDSENK
jgi:hypothetical protein